MYIFLFNIQITTTNRTLNTTVDLKCRLPKYKYEGPTHLVCKHGGWCKDNSTKLYKKDYPKCTCKCLVIGLYKIQISQLISRCSISSLKILFPCLGDGVVLNSTFNIISAILLRSVRLREEIGVPEENHRPDASH